MIKNLRSFLFSPTRTVFSQGADLRQPGALGDNVQVFRVPNETIVVNPATDIHQTTMPTHELVKQYLTTFETVMFSTGGITSELLACASLGFELLMLRIDASANAAMLETPANAAMLLLPAVDSIFKSEQLLRNEDPSLFRDENLDQVRLARELIDGHQSVLDAIDPLQWGCTARKIQAQWVVFDFCQRIGKNGSSAIDRNRILNVAMIPLRTLLSQAAEAAQQTKQLTATISHQVEASTLSRVKEALDAQAGSTVAVPPSSTGTVGLTGAHAPGQKPVPPGAMPVQPVHPKPKRRVGPGTQPTKTRTKKKAK